MVVVAVVVCVLYVHSVLDAGRIVVADLQAQVLSAACVQLEFGQRHDD